MNDSQRHNFRLYRERTKGMTPDLRQEFRRTIRLMAAGPIGIGMLLADVAAQAVMAHEWRQEPTQR